MIKAKLINGQLTYASNYMQIGANMVTNPTDSELDSEGYKDVIYEEVDEVIEQYGKTDTNIIVYVQKYISIIEKQLKIFLANNWLVGRSSQEIKAIDITLLEGLFNKKHSSRGYKDESKYYLDSECTNLAVEILYSLIYESEILTGQKATINWYYEDDTIAFSKELIENYSAKDAAMILKNIRDTRVAYLQNPEPEFVNATVKMYISMLFEHYKLEVSDYILSGSKDFENALRNETDSTINAILSAVLYDGKTVKESILYQIYP